MAHSVLANAVLVTLLVSSSALQVVPDEEKKSEQMCGGDPKQHLSAYEGFTPMYPDLCILFCVPEGECNGRAQTGRFGYLGLSGPGDCLSKGFTLTDTKGTFLKKADETLQQVKGPCKGMTITKYRKPLPGEEDPIPNALASERIEKRKPGKVCGPRKSAFEATKFQSVGVCTVYCIPEGECLGYAQMGEFNYLGISGEGNCKGYNETAPYDTKAYDVRDSLRVLHGACHGMQFHRFLSREKQNFS